MLFRSRRARSYASWEKKLATWSYRNQRLALQHCAALDRHSAPGQAEGEFRAGLLHAAREMRDREIEKLRSGTRVRAI